MQKFRMINKHIYIYICTITIYNLHESIAINRHFKLLTTPLMLISSNLTASSCSCLFGCQVAKFIQTLTKWMCKRVSLKKTLSSHKRKCKVESWPFVFRLLKGEALRNHLWHTSMSVGLIQVQLLQMSVSYIAMMTKATNYLFEKYYLKYNYRKYFSKNFIPNFCSLQFKNE